MTTDDKINEEKMQDDINREAVKYYHLENHHLLSLSSGKIDKYGYLTDEEIVPFNQRQVIEQAKFAYFSLGKTSKNKRKQLRTKAKSK